MAANQSKSLTKVKSLLEKKFAGNEDLLGLLQIETHDKHVTIRVPADVTALNELFDHADAYLRGLGYTCRKANRFATLSELADLLGEIEWLWHNWLPKGFLTMLVADPGVGKSTIALDFAKTVVTGIPFPLEAKPGHVASSAVWIEAESGQQMLNSRARSMRVPADKIYLPVLGGDLLGQPDLMNPTHQEMIGNLIHEVKPQIVIVDSLSGAQTKGENKVEEVRPLMQFLVDVARDERTCVMLLHHLNKVSGNESTEVSMGRVRGSGLIAAFARSIIGLDRGLDNSIKMSIIKSNLGLIPKPIVAKFISNEDERVEAVEYKPYEAPEPKRTKKELCTAWVWSLLTSNGGEMHLRDIVTAAEPHGYTRANLYAAKDALEGQIVVGGNGRDAIWRVANDYQAIEAIGLMMDQV